MVRPNYRWFRRSQFVIEKGEYLEHSAKGSEWEEHKYIKRIDGTYYYPNSYKGGRHLPDSEKKDDTEEKDKKSVKEMEDSLFDKIKDRAYDNPKEMLRDNFDEVLKDQLDVDWTTLPKEDVDEMQRNLLDRLMKLGPAYSDKKSEKSSEVDLSEKDVENLAKEVVEGKFGNGEKRKELLGENYDKIQKRVNELVSTPVGNQKVSSGSKQSVSKVETIAKKITDKQEAAKRSSSAIRKKTPKLPSLPKRK